MPGEVEGLAQLESEGVRSRTQATGLQSLCWGMKNVGAHRSELGKGRMREGHLGVGEGP